MPCSTTTYGYDAANRLTSVNGQAYQWDTNGNLLNDGTNAYAYNSQNRLTTLTQGGHTYGFSYSGNGDRLTQSVDGVVTRYTLDLNAGLTQVLADGSYAYLYGNDRIAQESASETDYFLGDALGSVRQLVDASGAIRLAKNYEPYGTAMGSVGNEASAYGFAGQAGDASGLTYLRARYYVSALGRFVSRDEWNGDMLQPISYNAWIYAYSSPTLFTDPSGYDVGCGGHECPSGPGPQLTPAPIPVQMPSNTPTATPTTTLTPTPTVTASTTPTPTNSPSPTPIRAGWTWIKGYTRAQIEAKAQNQFVPVSDPSGCASYSMAMALNLMYGGSLSGHQLKTDLEQLTWLNAILIPLIARRYTLGPGDWFSSVFSALPNGLPKNGLGMLPAAQSDALNDLAHFMDPAHPPYSAEYRTGASADDLISNVDNGYLTIVSVSWGSNALGFPTDPGVGHAMLLVGYDVANKSDEFAFLDPGAGRLLLDFSTRYGRDFVATWSKGNIFIPPGAMVTIKPNEPWLQSSPIPRRRLR